jgi:hypothetical protein
MKNRLSVKTLPDKRVQTDIQLIDGSTAMEIHIQGLYESKVLKKLLDKKFYQHFKGDWEISFPDDQWVATHSTFEKAIDAGDTHIFNRDNTISYDDMC